MKPMKDLKELLLFRDKDYLIQGLAIWWAITIVLTLVTLLIINETIGL
jgi:hypothetical protein